MRAPRQIAVLLQLKNLYNLAHLGQRDPQYLASLCPLSNTHYAQVSQLSIRMLNTVDPLSDIHYNYRLGEKQLGKYSS